MKTARAAPPVKRANSPTYAKPVIVAEPMESVSAIFDFGRAEIRDGIRA